MPRLIMQLNQDEEMAIRDTGEWHPQLQMHTSADGMSEDVIGGPFMFELDGGDRVVFENACTHQGGAILTHAEALQILAGEDWDGSAAGELMRRLELTRVQWDNLPSITQVHLLRLPVIMAKHR
jgi:hypothetical protein